MSRKHRSLCRRTIILGVIAAFAAALASEPGQRAFGAAVGGMFGLEKYVYSQLGPSLAYIPSSLVTYPFKVKITAEVSAAKEKVGGFIKGVCHANTDYEQIKGAGIEWNRCDIPFPFDYAGNLRDDYIRFKEKLKEYADNGIKIMAVTPYPDAFIEYGVDPRLPENEGRLKEIAIFLVQDLQGLAGALQISNELGVPRFVLPLTTEEAIRFMAVQLEAIYPVRGDVLVGYNSAGPQADIHKMMKPYLKYCDYVGIDVYIGCFTSFGNYLWVYDMMLDYLWSFTGKPVILCEFGYIGDGAPKTPEEKRAALARYGASSEAEARRNIKDFVKRLPSSIQNQVTENASGDWGNFLFNSDFKDHFYAELPAKNVIPAYPHTPEGQAAFYRDILPRLMNKPYLLGAFIYCYGDSPRCYVCGQSDCPIETRWGLTAMDGREKPAYFAVRDAWAE
ncbi:MAG: hypothetical protein LBS62_09060 [Clostridiales bacterium]|jgi:hypothetical protein|nr:hypothetical protein [Clostridiales bacterium]